MSNVKEKIKNNEIINNRDLENFIDNEYDKIIKNSYFNIIDQCDYLT